MAANEAMGRSAGQRRRVRTITNLTEEQRLHKRHQDRKGQRAMRERTKSRIQDLESELAELKAKSDTQDTLLKQELVSLRERNTQLESRLQQILRLATNLNSSAEDELPHRAGPAQNPVEEALDCITSKQLAETAVTIPRSHGLIISSVRE